MISVAVMAHNEAATIAHCLEAILSQDGFGPGDRVTVLENASTDRTADIVSDMAQTDPRIRLCQIELGDKANAWSVYTFGVSPDIGADGAGDLHVFVDGDVIPRAGSFAAMVEALAGAPDALAASALPYGGRTAEVWRARVMREHGLPGNFYALRGSTIRTMRDEGWCLPVGYMGDDTFLQWILKRRLDPQASPDKTAIQPVAGAGFDYESIPNTTLSGLWSLYKRQRTYQMRDIQSKILSDHVLEAPGNRPPRDIADLYGRATPMDALFGPFGKLTPVKMRKALFLYTWWRTRTRPTRRGAPFHAEGAFTLHETKGA